MEVERIFRKIPEFGKISLDTVLFESRYPVLFTCKDTEDIYMFICCLVNEEVARWIGTKTDYSTLIDLLENKITIRDAYLGITKDKILIEYDGKNAKYRMVSAEEIPDEWLPTYGEYMDAEVGEFEEELFAFKSRNKMFEFQIQPQISRFLSLR